MTAREVFEGVQIELNKVQAPSLLLEDFNYLFNKAIYQYINKKYNQFGVNQENTDSTQVLVGHTFIKPFKKPGTKTGGSKITTYNAAYSFYLPADYFHLLNCTCVFNVNNKSFKCYDEGDQPEFQATRLTADAWPVIINNFYMRPSYKRPYYYIYNTNTEEGLPSNPIRQNDTAIGIEGRDPSGDDDHVANAGLTDFPRTLKLKDREVSTVNSSTEGKSAGVRYGNPSNVVLEIRCGKDNSIFELQGINVDYLKTPQHIRLTQDQLDWTEDKSQVLEFPDYVCQEIINELTHLVMENASDPRLQTHIPVNTSIASPAQEQAPTRKR